MRIEQLIAFDKVVQHSSFTKASDFRSSRAIRNFLYRRGL